MKTLLKKLTETFSPSGYEAPIRDLIHAEIKDLADDIRVDALGNLIARKAPTKKSADGKKILFAAHMDEIGLVVNHVDKEGFARFSTLGGFRPHTLIGARLRFLNGAYGVVGAEYLSKGTKLIPLTEMYIDLGATSPEDCPVSIGDVAALERPFVEVGNRLIAKSMDDRAGVAVQIEVMRQLKASPHDLYFVFTTQEEVGVRGASTSAYGVNPEIGIAFDVCPTGDTPDSPKKAVKLGAGPAIKIKDPGMVADPRLVAWMIEGAEKAKIPYQREVSDLGSTDARSIQLARAGVIAGNISIPCRYVHSPSEMVDYRDMKNIVKLVCALLENDIHL